VEIAAGSHAWVEWPTEALEVSAQLIAIAPVTTAGACDQQHCEGYG
jgi:hypothetical protein